MFGLNVVGMVISPRSSHSFRFPVVGHDIVVVCELFVADRAYPALFDNFPVHQFLHFGGRLEFAIYPRVMRIFNSPNSKPDQAASGMSSRPQHDVDL
jgi:hypothetical protein